MNDNLEPISKIREIIKNLTSELKDDVWYKFTLSFLLDGDMTIVDDISIVEWPSEKSQLRSILRKCVDQLDVSEYCDCKGCNEKRKLVNEVNKILKRGDQ